MKPARKRHIQRGCPHNARNSHEQPGHKNPDSRTDWIRGKNHDEQSIGKPGCDASMKRDGLHMKRVRGGDYSENHPRFGPNELLSIT